MATIIRVHRIPCNHLIWAVRIIWEVQVLVQHSITKQQLRPHTVVPIKESLLPAFSVVNQTLSHRRQHSAVPQVPCRRHLDSEINRALSHLHHLAVNHRTVHKLVLKIRLSVKHHHSADRNHQVVASTVHHPLAAISTAAAAVVSTDHHQATSIPVAMFCHHRPGSIATTTIVASHRHSIATTSIWEIRDHKAAAVVVVVVTMVSTPEAITLPFPAPLASTTPSTVKFQKPRSTANNNNSPDTMPTLRPNAKYSTFAPWTPHSISCAPMERFSAKSIWCASGGINSIAIVPQVCTEITHTFTIIRKLVAVHRLDHRKMIWEAVRKVSTLKVWTTQVHRVKYHHLLALAHHWRHRSHQTISPNRHAAVAAAALASVFQLAASNPRFHRSITISRFQRKSHRVHSTISITCNQIWAVSVVLAVPAINHNLFLHHNRISDKIRTVSINRQLNRVYRSQ